MIEDHGVMGHDLRVTRCTLWILVVLQRQAYRLDACGLDVLSSEDSNLRNQRPRKFLLRRSSENCIGYICEAEKV